jgi:hypothetical protein
MPQDRVLHIVSIGSRTAADHAEDPPQTRNARVRTATGADPARAATLLLTAARGDQRMTAVESSRCHAVVAKPPTPLPRRVCRPKYSSQDLSRG